MSRLSPCICYNGLMEASNGVALFVTIGRRERYLSTSSRLLRLGVSTQRVNAAQCCVRASCASAVGNVMVIASQTDSWKGDERAAGQKRERLSDVALGTPRRMGQVKKRNRGGTMSKMARRSCHGMPCVRRPVHACVRPSIQPGRLSFPHVVAQRVRSVGGASSGSAPTAKTRRRSSWTLDGAGWPVTAAQRQLQWGQRLGRMRGRQRR